MWSTPKTDWAATDYYNIADGNRWRDNLLYIRDIAIDMYGTITLAPMYDEKTISMFPYASEMNAIEDNLEALNSATYGFDIGMKQFFVPNGHTVAYDEVNRIEQATLQFKTTLETQRALQRHCAFRLGNARTFDVVRV